MIDERNALESSNNILQFKPFVPNNDGIIVNDTKYVKEGGEKMDIEKYLDITNTRLSEMELRIYEERRLSEERMEKKFNEAMETSRIINQKLDSLKDSMNDKMDLLKESVHKDSISSKNWVVALCTTTMLGMVGLVIAILIAVS